MSERRQHRPTTGHPTRRAHARRRAEPPSRPPGDGKLGRVLLWTAIVLVLGGVAMVVFLTLLKPSGLEVRIPDAEADKGAEPAAGDRIVTLVFPEWDAMGFVTEQRRIPSQGRPEEELRLLLGELCAGPAVSGAMPALPDSTRALGVFLDAADGSCVLDFSVELVTRHPGGSAAENATLTALLRTVAINFPELATCRILVDGAPSETLAGHLAMDAPFALGRWR